jgi:hypothetical protein
MELSVLNGMPNYPIGQVFDGYKGKNILKENFDVIPIYRTWLYLASGNGKRRRIANYVSHSLTALAASTILPGPEGLLIIS